MHLPMEELFIASLSADIKLRRFVIFSSWNLHDFFSDRLRTGYNPSDIYQLQSHTALERLSSGGLEPFLSHTKKLCLASYYIQFSTNMKMYNLRLKPVFLAPRCRR